MLPAGKFTVLKNSTRIKAIWFVKVTRISNMVICLNKIPFQINGSNNYEIGIGWKVKFFNNEVHLGKGFFSPLS